MNRRTFFALPLLALPLPAIARQKQMVRITMVGKAFDYDAIVAELIPLLNAAARPNIVELM